MAEIREELLKLIDEELPEIKTKWTVLEFRNYDGKSDVSHITTLSIKFSRGDNDDAFDTKILNFVNLTELLETE